MRTFSKTIAAVRASKPAASPLQVESPRLIEPEERRYDWSSVHTLIRGVFQTQKVRLYRYD